MESLSHTDYVWLSYSLSAVVIAGLFCWIVVTGRRRRAQLEFLTAGKEHSSDER